MADRSVDLDIIGHDKLSPATDRAGGALSKLGDRIGRTNAGFGKLGKALEKDIGVRVDKLSGGMSLLAGVIGGPVGMALDSAVMGISLVSEVLGIVSLKNLRAAGSWIVHKTTMLAAAAASKVMAAGQWILNAALSANPIGLVIIGLALLVAGFILAWKNSETFRNVVMAVLGVLRQGFARFVDVVLMVLGAIVDGAAAAFGWVPGIGDKLKGASSAFHRFRDDVNATLAGIRDENVNVNIIVHGTQALRGLTGKSAMFNGKVIPIASGGIVTKPTLAVVGEGGESEAVVPLSKAAKYGFGGGGNGDTFNITIQSATGDPVAIARALDDVIRKAKRRGFIPEFAS